MKKFIAFCILGLSVAAQAGGSFNFSGKLRNFDANTIDVQDEKKIYTIERKALGSIQNDKIAKLKSGEKLYLEVPFDAVQKVKPLTH